MWKSPSAKKGVWCGVRYNQAGTADRHHIHRGCGRADAGRFEAVHDHLAAASGFFVVNAGEQAVHQAKQVREELFVLAISGEMGMGGHEAIGIDRDPVSIFIFE